MAHECDQELVQQYFKQDFGSKYNLFKTLHIVKIQTL